MQSSNKTPKFWFDLNGRKWGARFLTIAEQVQVQVEIERLTNGNYAGWARSEDAVQQLAAFGSQVAATLNKVLVVWPTDVDKFDLTEADDLDWLTNIWEAYSTAASTFRSGRAPQGASSGVGEGTPASAVVPDAVPSAAE